MMSTFPNMYRTYMYAQQVMFGEIHTYISKLDQCCNYSEKSTDIYKYIS